MPFQRKSLAVCLPGEMFSSRWVKNWTELQNHLVNHRDFAVIPLFEISSSVYHARNALADMCRSIGNLDYVLWMDDDNILDIEQFERLWADLWEIPDAAAIAGWAWCENQQYPSGAMISCGHIREDRAAVNYTLEEFLGSLEEIKAGRGNRQLKHVGFTGFPAVLMPARTLVQAGDGPFNPYFGDVHPYGMSGEDYAFCRRCTEKFGAKFFVDPLCQVPHLKLRNVTPSRFLQFASASTNPKECAA
jgi:hypothetical protein